MSLSVQFLRPSSRSDKYGGENSIRAAISRRLKPICTLAFRISSPVAWWSITVTCLVTSPTSIRRNGLLTSPHPSPLCYPSTLGTILACRPFPQSSNPSPCCLAKRAPLVESALQSQGHLGAYKGTPIAGLCRCEPSCVLGNRSECRPSGNRLAESLRVVQLSSLRHLLYNIRLPLPLPRALVVFSKSTVNGILAHSCCPNPCTHNHSGNPKY